MAMSPLPLLLIPTTLVDPVEVQWERGVNMATTSLLTYRPQAQQQEQRMIEPLPLTAAEEVCTFRL